MKTLLLVALLLSPAWAGVTRTISVDYTQADLCTVLKKKIAPALGKNIYLSPEVHGTVTASFKQIRPRAALELVLRMQDDKFAYKVIGNTIVVGTPERLEKIPDNLFR